MRRVETKCCDAQLVNILIILEFLIKLAMMKGFIKDVESESRGKSFSRPRNFLCVRLLSQLLSAFRLYILSQAERHKSHLRIRLPQFYWIALQVGRIIFTYFVYNFTKYYV